MPWFFMAFVVTASPNIVARQTAWGRQSAGPLVLLTIHQAAWPLSRVLSKKAECTLPFLWFGGFVYYPVGLQRSVAVSQHFAGMLARSLGYLDAAEHASNLFRTRPLIQQLNA